MIIIIAECSTPELPPNSVITHIVRGAGCGNAVGTSVTFHCEKGLFPDAPITIACTVASDNTVHWVPDVSRLKCTKDPFSNITGLCSISVPKRMNYVVVGVVVVCLTFFPK